MAIAQDQWIGICPRSDDRAPVSEEWRRDYYAKYCCSRCRDRWPRYAGQSIDVHYQYKPTRLPLQRSDYCVVALREFYKCFEDIGHNYIVTGQVLGPLGQIYDEFITLTAPYIICPRGGTQSQYSICTVCGNSGYYPMPHNYHRYLVRSDLETSRLLYLSGIYNWIIHESLLARIDLKTRKKLRITELPVREEPEDGIVDFPRITL